MYCGAGAALFTTCGFSLAVASAAELSLMAAAENKRRLALPGAGELNLSAADGPVGECKGSAEKKTS